MKMKKRALRKEFFMEIRKSMPRFLSIFFIVALGTAFFSGIQAAAPDMRFSGDAYFDEEELMDLKVISTLGLTQDDVDELGRLSDIEYAEGSYLCDVLTGDEDNQKALRFESLSENLNLVTVEEGCLPVKTGECLMDYEYARKFGYKVGDTLHIKENLEEDEDAVLKTDTYTITGTCSSPLYIAFSRGNTDIGNGEISGFIYVPADTFDTDYYMQIYMKVQGAGDTTAYLEGYDTIVAGAKAQVESIEEERCEARYAEIQEEAREKVEEARQELADGRQEADEKLADAKQELADAQKKLADGRQELEEKKQELADGKQELTRKKQELADAKQQIADGWTRLNSAKQQLSEKEAEYNKEKTAAQKKITKGERQLAEGEKELKAKQKEFEQQKAEFQTKKKEYESSEIQYQQKKAEYDSGYAQFTQGKSQYEAGVASLAENKKNLEQLQALIDVGQATEEQQGQARTLAAAIAQGEQRLAATKAQLDAAEQSLLQAAQGIAVWKEQLDTARPQITEGEKQITEGEKQLNTAQKKLDASEKELEAAKQQLKDGKKQLDNAKEQLSSEEAKLVQSQKQVADGESQIADAEKELADGEEKLADAEKEIEENEKKLADGQKEYEDAKAEAEDTIADGEKKIADAEKEIDDIEKAEWTLSDRSDVPEYTGYGENADRIRNIGKVFPVIFFLVAALISLTTMTRMVEEERTQIGTLKALGYGKASIAAKYVMYALLATLGGSIVGVLIGEKILPYIIIQAYGIMYMHMNNIQIPYNMTYGVMATAAAVFCTMAATMWACARELHAWPAVLMRPPAPKQGKRVLLERVTFLWSRLSFTWKSTIRNLFRYKKRFFMTILGIGGCMGLLLVGFGLRDSIMDVAVLQYQKIHMYDGTVILDEDAEDEEIQKLTEYLSSDAHVENFTSIYMKKMELCSESAEREAYLMVIPDDMQISEFVQFNDRTSEEVYTLDDSGIILTEKTGKLLDVSVGDSVYLDGEQSDVEMPIAHICENYMSHYVYMTESLYRSLYGAVPEYNCIIYRVVDRDDTLAQEVGKNALSFSAALSVLYTSNIRAQLNHMLKALDAVILVLIVSAGMLAFVVLYNLNNININERKRELATIKVLGFYDREVSAYVYRENILLTILGSIFGIFFGIVLHRFVIVTVEVDSYMFGRNINLISFVFAVLITFGFSIIVNIAMHFKLKKIDMVESLKSVE